MALYFRREVFFILFILNCTIADARRISACNSGVCGFQQMSTCGAGGCGFRTFSMPEVPTLPGVQVAVRPDLDEAFGTRDYWIPRMQNSPTGMKHIRLDNQGWATFVDNQRVLHRLGKDASGQIVVRINTGATVPLSSVSPEGARELESLMAARNPAAANASSGQVQGPVTSGNPNVLGSAESNGSRHAANANAVLASAADASDVSVIDSASSLRAGSRSVASTGPSTPSSPSPASTSRSNPTASSSTPSENLPEKTEEEVSGPEWNIECRRSDGACFATNTVTGEVVRVKKPGEVAAQTQTPSPQPVAPKVERTGIRELEIKNMADYGSLRRQGGKVVVLTFGYKGCPGCDQLEPVLNGLKGQIPGVTFAHADTRVATDVLNFFAQNGRNINLVPATLVMRWNPETNWYSVSSSFTGARGRQDLEQIIQGALNSNPTK